MTAADLDLDHSPRHARPAARRGERIRTVAEQIADHLAVAIVNGEYRGGERIREQEVAALYSASRAPRARGDPRPRAARARPVHARRGAYVIDLSVDTIADVFNMRAVLMGLAARMIALRRDPAALDEFRRRLDAVAAVVGEDDPVRFARLVGRAGGALVDICASEPLVDLLRRQVRHSIWGLIWREKPLDFLTEARRRAALAEWRDLQRALEAGDDAAAETLQRRIHFNARDHALRNIQFQRNEQASSDRAVFERDEGARA